MSAPRILFVLEAGPLASGGHVTRGLALASAFTAQGATCAFLGRAGNLLAALAPDAPRLTAGSDDPHDLAQAIGAERFDALVIDHDGLAEPDHKALGQGRPVLVVDSRADRPLGADMVLDPTPGRRAEEFDPLTPDGARMLLGPTYAPVRAEFTALRPTALGWRGEPVQRLIASMGLADPEAMAVRATELMRQRAGSAGIDVVLGPTGPNLSRLNRIARHDTRLALHVETPHVARLMAEADIAVGDAGASAWERCALGLPSITVMMCEAQRPMAYALAERKASIVVDGGAADFDETVDKALLRLMTDARLRRQLADASSEFCDGQGAARVAEAFLKLVAARR